MSSGFVSTPSVTVKPSPADKKTLLKEVLPKAGLVYSEKGNLSEVLSKPKIMPIKSITLQKIEKMEQEAAARKEV